MRGFRQLAVFELAHKLALTAYRLSADFPQDERFGLTSQLRRAAASVPTNVAEGAGRSSPVDFARFLDIAIGSACEVEYLTLLAHDLGYLDDNQLSEITRTVIPVRRMLFRLATRLRTSARANT
ncbi:MAG: four helix bundle protein [Dehalococcoidia bacterium]